MTDLGPSTGHQPTPGAPPLPPVTGVKEAAAVVAKIAMLDSQLAEIEETARSEGARTAAWKRRETEAIASERALLVASLEPWAREEIARQEKTRRRSSVTVPWGSVELRHSHNAGLVVTDERAAADALTELLPQAVSRSVLVSAVNQERRTKDKPEGRVSVTEGKVFVDGELVPGLEWREAGERIVKVSARETPLRPADG